MVNLKKINGTKILGEFNYSLDYESNSNERSRIIYAENGSGKTNFMKAVDYLANPSNENLELLSKIPFERIEILTNTGEVWVQKDNAYNDQEMVIGATYAIGEEKGRKQKSRWSTEAKQITDLNYELDALREQLYNKTSRRKRDKTKGSSDQELKIPAIQRSIKDILGKITFVGTDRMINPYFENNFERYLTLRKLENAEFHEGPGEGSRELKRLLEHLERKFLRSAVADMTGNKQVYQNITKSVLQGNVNNEISAVASRERLQDKISSLLRNGEPQEKYGLIGLNQIRAIEEEINKTRVNDKNLRPLYPILHPYLEDVVEQIERLKPISEKISTFLGVANGMLSRKEFKFDGKELYLSQKKDNQPIPSEALSSGESQLIGLLCRATLASNNDTLIIIDEPEISLGLTWQRRIVSVLEKCSNPEKVKFLFATHSAQVASQVDPCFVVSPNVEE